MLSSLRDRTILIAGASSGLGAVTARELAAEGARLILSYHSRPIPAGIQADLTLPADRARLLDAAPGLYGLVIFAGMPARSDDLIEESMRVNCLGPLALAREAAARMDSGAIVLLGTMQAVVPFPNSTPYAAAKAALLHGMRILAKERRHLRINAVAPGVMQAGMAEASIASGKYRRYLDEGLIPRYGRPEDVARAVRFFLEPDNYITGQTLVVDGGFTL